MIKPMRWLLGAVVGFLALDGIIASATHYLQEPYNPGFLEYPVIVALHVVLGGVYLALAPFQLVKRISSRHPGYHRWVGRMLVSIGLVVGATALFMGLVIPFSGWIERAYIGLFGTFFLLGPDVQEALDQSQRVALHREWMIRAFALGLAVATMRLIFVPPIIVVADPTQSQLQALSAASLFLVAFVVHASVAEAWIRLTRKRRVPEASGAKAAYEPISGRG
jgi:hypothetical protein